jgi:hypothetical protein
MAFHFSVQPEFLMLNERLPLETTQRSHAIQVNVYPQWYKQVSISWTVPAQFGACVYNVYFSSSEDSGFQKLNSTPLTDIFFEDTTTEEFRKWNRGFYVVEAILTQKNNVAIRSKPVSWEPAQRNWVTLRATEIQRREYWLLSRFTGIKSYLFRAKTFGKRCPYCWNPNLELVMDDRCPYCAGTSFENGYYNASPMYVQYDPNQNSELKGYFGVAEPNQLPAWTISVPEIHVGDVVVRTGSWDLYRVDKITPTELQGNTVRQILLLTQLAKRDVEYVLIGRGLPEFPSQYYDDTLPEYDL